MECKIRNIKVYDISITEREFLILLDVLENTDTRSKNWNPTLTDVSDDEIQRIYEQFHQFID